MYYEPSSYEDYRGTWAHDTRAIRETRMIADRLAALPAPHRDRVRIAVTEYGARNLTRQRWPDRNNLGHAIAVFDMLGRFLLEPRVEFACHWVTRWFDEDDWAFTSLSRKNELTPVGRAIAIWGGAVRGLMVKVETADPQVLAFATYDPAAREVVVLLGNKDTVPRKARLVLPNAAAREAMRLTGWGEEDPAPVWAEAPRPKRDGNGWRLLLPPVSITVCAFQLKARSPGR
jgi:hypothetical protein